MNALLVSPTRDRVITLLFITRFEGLVVIDPSDDWCMECDDDWTPAAEGSDKGEGCADSDVLPGADVMFSGVRKS